MPFIEMKTAKATTEQKEKLVEGFTRVASETEAHGGEEMMVAL